MTSSGKDVVLAGWGRAPRVATRLFAPDGARAAADRIATQSSLIARGAGRSYGDAALNPRAVLATDRLGDVHQFDSVNGIVIAGAGLRLRDLIARAVPLGWFPPVVPGTAEVTLGGMVAADVHGKNHHVAGTLSRWLRGIRLRLADGSVRDLRPGDPLLAATAGGMGLTGLIETVTLQMIPIPGARVVQQTQRFGSLEAVLDGFEESAAWPYTVAWIDCLAGGAATGRSVLYRGEHAAGPAINAPTRPSVRFDTPSVLLNRWSLRAFNAAYYHAARSRTSETSIGKFFFPLDAIGGWNRLYGRRGFHQHQSVIPLAAARPALRAMLAMTADRGLGSFLAVLKIFGEPSPKVGPLSFPMRGATLALDFPNTPRALGLMNALDHIVLDHGGRLYLAKDSRSDRHMLQNYDTDAFSVVRDEVDPDRRFTSCLSERLGL